MEKQKLLVLVGPTAVGKTELSLRLAEVYDCEILSADSMQVYRGMDIGTAKATIEERQRITHHLIDIRNPDEPFSVTEYQQLAVQCIDDIASRGHLPFLVGGTGLYVQSVTYGYQFTDVGADEAFRQELHRTARENGPEALWQRLSVVDPESAERLHPNDVRRIIRALEIFRISGRTMTEHLHEQKLESPYHLYMIGLTRDRDQLYKRINQRVDIMLQQGLVDEVKGLLDKGYSDQLVSMQGLGYKEIASYLRGDLNYDEAVELLKRDTRRFAKRQLSWFRRMKAIDWYDLTDSHNEDKVFREIISVIEGKFA